MTNQHITIIAEAGVNHNGDLAFAKKMIEVASEAGADYVKFQTFKASNLVTLNAKKAEYQIENTGASESQYEMLKKLEISKEDHYELVNHCNHFNIKFFSTAFDIESVYFLKSLDLGLWKIPSGEITNKPYLQLIGSFNQPTILSTGMSTMDEIKQAIWVMSNSGLEDSKLTVLHCTSDYPTQARDVNLEAIKAMQGELGLPIGYSDHTLGYTAAIGAVALGVVALEKHFTLDKTMKGPDHKASLSPSELKEYITLVRQAELMRGNGVKEPTARELETRKIARKSLFINKALMEGMVINMNDIDILRPGDGISSMDIEDVIGRKIGKDVEAGYKLTKSDLR